MRLTPIDLPDVSLTDPRLLAAREANRAYLLSLPVDRLLYAFRVNAGLPAPGEPLGGWEAPDCELRGHFVGHCLSACALHYHASGDGEILTRGMELVAGLGECQRALGRGYLSAWPEAYLDRLEALDRPTWAPLYTIHKLLAGLLDMARLTGSEQAWSMLLTAAEYYRQRLGRMSDHQVERMLTVEFGGMAEVFYNLAAVSGDAAHLDLAHRYDQAAFLGPLALGRDNLSYLHGNTQIPKAIGAARRYELTGDETYRRIVEFFWDCVVRHRTYAMGGTTSGEIWPEPDRLAATLGSTNAEICKTHNLLKLARHLLSWTGDAEYADYLETAFLNGILGTQRVDTGQMLYYVPLYPGLTKSWGTPFDSFWCCYGTGIETWAKLGDSIAWHDGEALWLGGYVASSLTWREKGITLTQVTDYPHSERIELRLSMARPTLFTLRLRLPGWLRQPAGLTLNGARVPLSVDRGWASVSRLWRDGDTLRLHLPMDLVSVPMPDDSAMVALRRGPLVLAALDPAPGAFVVGAPERPLDWTEGPAPRLMTTGGAVPLVPLNEVVDEAYGVYFQVAAEGSARHEQLTAGDAESTKLAARLVDRVRLGDRADELAHELVEEASESGAFAGRPVREAYQGWWRWKLRTVPDTALALSCLYNTGHTRGSFDILINGHPLLTETLRGAQPWQFFRRDYALPAELLIGSQWLTVEFRAHPKSTAGGVFDCAVVRAEPAGAPEQTAK